LVGKPEGKRTLERRSYRWEDNIIMDFSKKDEGVYGLDRAGSGWGQVAGNCQYGNEPSGFHKMWVIS
jgi:hypothetical protein